MSFQSPPASGTTVAFSIPRASASHENDNNDNDVPLCCSPPFNERTSSTSFTPLSATKQFNYRSNDNLLQRQREPSITELDRIQRERREQTERRNVELQSSSILDKLMAAQDSLPLMYPHEEHEDVKINLNVGNDVDVDVMLPISMEPLCDPSMNMNINMNTINSFPSSGSRRRRRPIAKLVPSSILGTRTRTHSKRAPAPRLRIRPHRNIFNHQQDEDDQAPVIIRNANDEDETEVKFADMFMSPHSNKMVLQFPKAPFQEITLDDTDELGHGHGQAQVNNVQEQLQLQDLTLIDSEHSHDEHQHQHQQYISQRRSITINSPEKYLIHRIRSESSLIRTNHEDEVEEGDVHVHCDNNSNGPTISSPSEASTSTSPLPIKRMHYRKKTKKILLKPKRRINTLSRKSSFEPQCSILNGDHFHSPSSSSASSASTSTCTCTAEVPTATAGAFLPLPAFNFPSMIGGRSESVDQIMAQDLNLKGRHAPELSPFTPLLSVQANSKNNSNANANADGNPNPRARANNQGFPSLKPKSLITSCSSHTHTHTHTHAHTNNNNHSDESGDIVMELDPNLSISRDLEASFEQQMQQYDEVKFTPLRYRRKSVVFVEDSNDGQDHQQQYNINSSNSNSDTSNNNRSRSQSSSSIQEQIEMAKQAAARFGVGLGERSSSRDFTSPNLSESNFRTPNASSVRRGWAWGSNGATPTHQEEEKKRMVGLFLPKLFPSASEDEIHHGSSSAFFSGSGSGPGHHSRERSNSFLDMMKGAFSPALSWKKSPIS